MAGPLTTTHGPGEPDGCMTQAARSDALKASIAPAMIVNGLRRTTDCVFEVNRGMPGLQNTK